MLALFALFGCTPFGPWADGSAVDTGVPTERVVASPGRIDFGTVSVNEDGFALSTFTLYNLGSAAVTITGHDEPIGSEAFVVAAAPVITLDPGAELELSVRFAPTTDESATASIVVQPGEETVEFTGVGTAPALDIGAPEIDPVVLGCTGTGHVSITNRGSEEATLSDATVDDAEFAVTSLPASVLPGETADIGLSFTPGGGGERGGTLLLSTNDPLQPEIGLTVSGLGYEGERVTQTFRYTPSNPTDLMFVVATRGGRTDQLDRAEDVIPLFVQSLRDTNIDYQVTALSGAAPCPSSTPGWADRSDSTLQAESVLDRGFTGPGGPWDDDLVGLAGAALAQTGPGGCLDGFRRADADLHLIIVTDGPSQADADEEAETIAGTVVAPAAFLVSALLPTSGTCGEPAPDYAALTEAYDGTAFDLCAADWTSAFLGFATLPTGRGAVRYALDETPVVSTLEVLAEGVAFTSWTYDAASNAVVFDGDQVPALGAEITIRYVSAVACE